MGRFTERRFVKPRPLNSEERQRVEQILRETLAPSQDIVFAYVFGSFARGEPCRDIDVALYTNKTLDDFTTLDLTALLQSLTGLAVDVILMRKAPVALQFAVFRDGQLLFSKDEPLRQARIEKVSRQYREYAHFRNLFLGVAGARSGQNR